MCLKTSGCPVWGFSKVFCMPPTHIHYSSMNPHYLILPSLVAAQGHNSSSLLWVFKTRSNSNAPCSVPSAPFLIHIHAIELFISDCHLWFLMFNVKHSNANKPYAVFTHWLRRRYVNRLHMSVCAANAP